MSKYALYGIMKKSGSHFAAMCVVDYHLALICGIFVVYMLGYVLLDADVREFPSNAIKCGKLIKVNELLMSLVE